MKHELEWVIKQYPHFIHLCSVNVFLLFRGQCFKFFIWEIRALFKQTVIRVVLDLQQ